MAMNRDGERLSGSEISEADVEKNSEDYPLYMEQQIRKIADGQPTWLRTSFDSDQGKLLHYFFKGSHCGYILCLYREGSQVWGTGFGPDQEAVQLNRLEKPIADIETAKQLLEMNAMRRWELANQNRTFRDLGLAPPDDLAEAGPD
jgi:hypothetical protein